MATMQPDVPKYQIVNERVARITDEDREARGDIKGLGYEIVDRHNTSNPVLDEENFTRLWAFYSPESFPPSSTVPATLNAEPFDPETESNNLSKLIVATHGTDKQFLSPSEVETLKRFFPVAGRSPAWST